jgi:hypothetical protein
MRSEARSSLIPGAAREGKGDKRLSRYSYDEIRVVFEVVDREVVLIDLDAGHYYVMDGSAAAIWRLAAAGADIGEITEALVGRYGGAAEPIETAVRQFVEDLCADTLLVPASEPRDPAGLAEARRELAVPAAETFEPPVFYKYTDMARLIQMDPIQDFDPSGWPRPRTSSSPRQD